MINIKKLLNLEFYTSPLDLFLAKLRAKQKTYSKSENAEREKYDRIFKLRDSTPEQDTQKARLWDKF
jgi:hypothetical protein